ncbi:hypothetical protein [Sulfurovum sp. NBC37-1]|uniref:hypothetical protein n=1 Tax=Sulfurovum sp. (strain NBC37-1) TaxID=387093 RepID=UPI0001587D8D|nr:hypothetical protein [Sulfurovum sp. NBC37-1]BAF73203.1 hypothetical protein SUN_2263 [Sulfurovum sp. NBC37-1]
MIKVSYPKNIADEYYELIANTKMQKFQNRTFESYYNQYIKKKLDGCELEDLLYGEYEKLVKIKNKIDTKYSSKKNIVKEFFNYDKSSNVKLSKSQPKISKFFEEKVEVDTCYFCNIEFINKFKISDGKFKNGFTLDHYIDKEKYPYLALSLYNLIPSCYTCNSKVKSIDEIDNLSPSSAKFDFDDKVKFRTFMMNKNLQVEKEKDFALLLKEDFSLDYKKYIDGFMLNERYEYHKYKVIEMINKRKQYPDSRLRELADLTQKTEEEVKHDLFGEYLFEDDLHKRPLSKLTKDIAIELGLV